LKIEALRTFEISGINFSKFQHHIPEYLSLSTKEMGLVFPVPFKDRLFVCQTSRSTHYSQEKENSSLLTFRCKPRSRRRNVGGKLGV